MFAWDLIVAIVLMTSLTIAAYLAGRNAGRGVCNVRPWLFLETLAFTLLFGCFFSGRLFWAHIIPGSAVIHWSNLMPLLVAFAAGLACRAPGLTRWRRTVTVAVLAGIAVGHLYLPILRPILSPVTLSANTQWRDGVCLQSHSATCGAAATATLLRQEGIIVDEDQMVRACLTSGHGTETLGLYCGLQSQAERFDREAKVAVDDPSQWHRLAQLPNVAVVRFAFSDNSGPIRWLLGRRGEGHAVVVLDRQGSEWIIADPAVGRVRWSDEVFRARFTGDAIYLAN
jgi:predicted double-glycine peptidase